MTVQQLSLDELLAMPLEAPASEPAAIPPEIAARLERLSVNELRYLNGPIVYHPGGWDAGDVLPRLIPQARLELVLSGEQEMATLEEVLAYLSSASLVFPLSSEDAEVMFWLTQTVFEKHRLVPADQHIWEMLGHKEPFTLTPFLEKEVLNRLRREIRSAVVRHAKRAPKTSTTELCS